MPVDYRKQYTSDQLEPLWPNAAIRGTVAALVTLAFMTVLAVLPVLLHRWGLGHWMEESTPADPRVTPLHIRPEWYFLASYQALKLFPSQFLGVSGNTLGVFSEVLVVLGVGLLPFWVRRRAVRGPTFLHGFCVTLVIILSLALTVWGTWPPSPLLLITICVVLLTFYVLIIGERRRMRRVLLTPRDPTE